jgi:hypothetical protein
VGYAPGKLYEFALCTPNPSGCLSDLEALPFSHVGELGSRVPTAWWPELLDRGRLILGFSPACGGPPGQ